MVIIEHSYKVPLGVVPHNENSKDGMLKIMEELQKLVSSGNGHNCIVHYYGL
jgi:hypothetical protein